MQRKIQNKAPTAPPEWLRSYLLRRRQAMLMELGEIEELLGLERSVTPKRKRGEGDK